MGGMFLKENKVGVECINKVVINRIDYDITFGPAHHKAYEDDTSNE